MINGLTMYDKSHIDCELVFKMFKEGRTCEQIGKLLGITQESAHDYVVEYWRSKKELIPHVPMVGA